MFDPVPDDWRQEPLDAIAEVILGQSPPSSVVNDFGVGLAFIQGNAEFGPRHPSPVLFASEAPKTADTGDVLLSVRAPVGEVNVAEGPLCIGRGVAALRARSCDPEFLFYAVGGLQPAFARLSQGSTFDAINGKELRQLPMFVPPRDEQRRIAEVLQSVDETHRIQVEVLRQLHETKAAAVEHFMIEAAEEGKTVLSAITANMDSGWSPDCESIPAGAEEWSVLKTSAVTWEGYDDHQNKRLPASLQPRPHLVVQAGDILITRAGPAERTGVVAMVDATNGRRMLSDKLIRVRVDLSRAVPLAVAEMLGSNAVQAELGRVKSGMAASQTNITQKIVANLEVPLPPLETQRRFASAVGSFNELIKLTTAQRDRLRGLKSQLASDLLSGRVRVPA